ncbi:putative quinol monooxygenase [Rhodococcus opacus]|uniref:Quinol monooxygenase n=1 Tax=Rhodococcus opacus TaxID=37919 RepID=A0AAX3Y717_RHOOP|nr:putative quinol monooxygenase [Rhodococcus opacus]MCZ4589975.1 putative quinol monooxygenase [Rhodococcus opacus]WLF44500.1 putative quinol monooxygenase [Rhodococcus opacus]
MLIVVGSAQAVPGHRAALVDAARAVTEGTRGDEGCESYGFYADLFDENTIVGIEIWRSRTDLEAHMDHEHTRAFLAAFPGLVVGEPGVTMYEVS